MRRAEITLARNRLAAFDREVARLPHGATYDDQGWGYVRDLLAHIDDSLDAAWADAEAALPEGWGIGVHRSFFSDGYEAEGRFAGVWHMANGSLPGVIVTDATPAAALRALAAKLRTGS